MERLTISWSSLKRWEDCGHRWRKVRDGKRRDTQNRRVFLAGTVTDLVMRNWLMLDEPPLGWMVDNVGDYFAQQAKSDYIKWQGDPQEDARKLLAKCVRALRALEPWLADNVLPYDYQPELRFRVPVGIPHPHDGTTVGIDLLGGIDLAVRRAETDYRLYDLKTTIRKAYLRESLGQGVFYDVGFGAYIGDPSQPTTFGFVAPLLDPILHEATITDEDRNYLYSRIVAMAHGIWDGKFDPKESDVGCKWCEVRHVCPKWAIVTEPDEFGQRRAKFSRVGTS